MVEEDVIVANPDKIREFKQIPYDVTFSQKDSILYALGVGFQQDPMNRDHYRFTNERRDDFTPFPTNCLSIVHRGVIREGDFDIPGLPEFNPMMMLHGEETLYLHKRLQPGSTYIVQETYPDFIDKKTGGVLVMDAEVRNKETNELQSVVRT